MDLSSNIVIAVYKQAILEQIDCLNTYLQVATNIGVDDTFARINMASKYLYMAKGLHQALFKLKVLSNWREVKEDIERIEAKIEFIRAEKNKYYRPEVRRS